MRPLARPLVFLTALLALGSVARAAEPGPLTEQRFMGWFHEQFERPSTVPSEVARVAARYRYVFVAGFLNEGIGRYFSDNEETLVDMGVPEDSIDILYPSSGSPVSDNEVFIERQLLKISKKGSEKLVLIGHSKGCAELLSWAVQHSAFVKQRVQAIFLIQAALGGSGVADYIQGEGHPVDDDMVAGERWVFRLTAAGGRLLDGAIGAGMKTLTHSWAKKYWSDLFATYPAGVQAITDRVFYIRGHMDPGSVNDLIYATAWYLQTYYGNNDGMVALKDQSLPQVGRILGTLWGDHSDLTVSRPTSRKPPILREALTKAIAMALAAQAGPGSDDVSEN